MANDNQAVETRSKQVGIDAFLRENVSDPVETKEVPIERLGLSITIQSLTEKRMAQIRKQSTRKFQNKSGEFFNETDDEKLLENLIVAAVVNPDLTNAKLQESWGAIGHPASILKTMLRGGEYTDLSAAIQKFSGFDVSGVTEVANDVKK
ncbi:phage tail assembly chaperone [Lactiplantibacillus herbarum]|uniref:phage tail assembly chaperone n=1 Tax=Lactiplantibacillus herbarum TaxID=1670446 RepID=UPI00064F23E4|nr:hypothetical protein [Lactiplantibacillus herbarum]